MGGATRRARRLWRTLRRELREVPSVAITTLVLGLLLTACAAFYVARQVAVAEEARLDREAAATERAVTDRLARYLDALQGTRGLFAASAAVDREDWAAYIRALDLQGRYPGTRSIAYARWVPAADEAAFLAEMRAGGIPEYAIQRAGEAAAYVPLTYIEPLSEVGRRALGFDALADAVRRPALERARDTGLPAATASTALAGERGGAEQRSILLYVPVYRGGGVPGTVAERRAALHGFVLTGWRMDDLMAGVLGPRPSATFAFAITDVSAPGLGQLLYASDGVGAATTAAALARPDQRRTLDVAGRTWMLSFAARPTQGWMVTAFIAVAGVSLSLLLGLTVGARGLRQAAKTATALREAAESFASLFDASEAIAITDGGRVVAINRAYTQHFGWAPEELVGRPGIELVVPTDRPGTAARMAAADEQPYAIGLRHRDGTTVPVEIVGRTIRYHGRPARLATVRDVTERERVAAALAARTRALEAKTREQEAFLYTVAHDLRAPLLSLRGMAGLLAAECGGDLAGDGRLYIDRIVANAGRMQALLDELLELARVGRIDVDLAPVALDAVVADVCAQLHHTLATRGARVEVAGPLPTVRANRTRMVQLFANLIANAVHYTPPDRAPAVRIAAAPHPDGWELTVADNGVGIPAAYRDRVLGLFQRLPAGKALNPGGTGAGLAIVARIAETHGGAVWFESAEGGGTTCHVTLPDVLLTPTSPRPSSARQDLTRARVSEREEAPV